MFTKTIILLRQQAFVLLTLAVVVFIVYLPILLDPNLLLRRNNDLQEQFWPVFYFISDQFWLTKELPFWNNLFFSGTPLLPDPQFPLFYPLNLIFLIFPTAESFIIYFLIHTLMGGAGSYILARKGLGFPKYTSLFAASLYVTSPRLAGYLEAGHYGLVASLAWLPFVALFIIKLFKNPGRFWAILLALSLSALFFTHTINFILVLVATSITFVVMSILMNKAAHSQKSIHLFVFAGFLTIGFTAITLLPQLEWIPNTTRALLLGDRDVYPKWGSHLEFLRAVFAPWLRGKEEMWRLDTEKWLVLGITPSLLALWGFTYLRTKLKLTLLATAGLAVILTLNNISPLYSFLLSQNWYVLMRVSTRIWFIPVLITVFLAAFGFQKLTQNIKNKIVLGLIGLLAIGEYLSLSWFWLYKPIPSADRFAPKAVYEFLKQDKDRFRVFCVTRCLSQKEAAEYNLELVEGYNTLQQKNYYNQFIQISQVFWDRYTLSLPPFEIYNFREIQPHAPTLAEFNIKYIISPHKLIGENFVPRGKFDSYYVYENNLVKPRAYFPAHGTPNELEAPIIFYSPNLIRVDTTKQKSQQLVLAEVWSPGWNAYLDGEEKVEIQETPNSLRLIEIKPHTQFTEFRYEPESFRIGKWITTITLFILITLGAHKYLKPGKN